MNTVSAHTFAIATLSTSTFAIAALVVFLAIPTYAAMTNDISSTIDFNEFVSSQ